jgi:hypothetical protein
LRLKLPLVKATPARFSPELRRLSRSSALFERHRDEPRPRRSDHGYTPEFDEAHATTTLTAGTSPTAPSHRNHSCPNMGSSTSSSC